jgi:hypothetical protein
LNIHEGSPLEEIKSRYSGNACYSSGSESFVSIKIKEHTLSKFEKRMLRGISGPEREKATAGSRKLQTEKLHNTVYTLHKILLW